MAECALRRALERAVEEMLANVQALIGTLDELAGDPDLEPDADAEPDADPEPSLGWSAPEAPGPALGAPDLED